MRAGRIAQQIPPASEHTFQHVSRLEFQALLDFPWIFQLRGSPIREIVEREFRGHHAALPPGLVETSSFLTTTDLIAHSRMIAVIPQPVANRLARHNLRVSCPTHLPICRCPGVPRPAHQRRFLDLIVEMQ
jgi:DNA-binding transcriptional LysR family regulator